MFFIELLLMHFDIKMNWINFFDAFYCRMKQVGRFVSVILTDERKFKAESNIS